MNFGVNKVKAEDSGLLGCNVGQKVNKEEGTLFLKDTGKILIQGHIVMS